MPLPSAAPALLLLVKATCLLLAALAASRLLRRAEAGAPPRVWLVALVGLLALPAVAAWAPLPLPVLPASAAMAMPQEDPVGPTPVGLPAATTPPAMAAPGGERQPTISRTGATPVPSEPMIWTEPDRLVVMLAGAWAVVARALALRLGYGAWSVRRIVRRARPLAQDGWQAPLWEIADRLGLDSAPRLVRSEDVKMPFAAGLLSSTIVLPAESDDWSAERRSAVLIHELGHVRRRDLIGHTLGRVACLLYWFHPLVWTAARRLRAESERACDDLALALGARPSDYAEHLLDIVAGVRDHATPAVALALAGGAAAPVPRQAPPAESSRTAVDQAALTPVSAPTSEASRKLPGTGLAANGPDSRRPEANRLADREAHERHPGLRFPAAQATDTGRRANGRGAAAAGSGAAATGTESPATGTGSAAATMRLQAATAVATDSGDGTERAAVLAKMLREDRSASVRRVAAWGLENYAETDVAQSALTAALAGDADAEVREMAAWALAGARRGSGASAALVKALRQDRDPRVRATAVWALGEVGDPAAVEALTPALRDPNA
jgi:beta-lactamase regulating signal transducer with metallopeptidase domain